MKSSVQTTGAAAQIPEPKPGPQIERLRQALEGTWSIKERLAPDTASPSGATGEGRIVWRPGPAGFSVVEDYWSRQGRRKIAGLGVFWWDEAEHGYRTIWCDSTNPGGCINFKNVARWDGSRLVLVEDYEINRKKFTFMARSATRSSPLARGGGRRSCIGASLSLIDHVPSRA